MPPSPVFCRQPASAAPRLSASTAGGDSAPKLIPRDVDDRRRAERVARGRAAPPSTFAGGQLVLGRGAGLAGAGGGDGNASCLMIR